MKYYLNIFFLLLSFFCSAKKTPLYDLVVNVYPEQRLLECKGTLRLTKEWLTNNELELSLSSVMREFEVQVLYPSLRKEDYDFFRSDSSGTTFQ